MDKKNIVYDVEGSRKLGKLEERLGKILRKLTAERGIEFQLYFQLKDGQISHGRRRFQGQARHAGPPASLRVIIYGPFYCYNTVGDFLTECSLYLQDPFRCDRNVLYCNPHLLSYIDEERITTFQLNTTQGSRQIEESGAQQDPLTLLRSEKLLPETEPSSSLVAKLYRYETSYTRLRLWVWRSYARSNLRDRWRPKFKPAVHSCEYFNNLKLISQVIRSKLSLLCYEERKDGLLIAQMKTFGAKR